MSEQREPFVDTLQIGIQLIELAAKLAPTLGTWLEGLLDGRTDPISTRVSDVMPARSRSRAAQHDLEDSV
ncbi:hypothetical protein LZC95_50285 [Pendulispora brunnea]|uniref:Uncharacterized protein n=1 Tax=Pendulispora brunnea TaxID=2905690 RepID=A0ABZ2KBY1_9BACT